MEGSGTSPETVPHLVGFLWVSVKRNITVIALPALVYPCAQVLSRRYSLVPPEGGIWTDDEVRSS